MPPRRLRLCSQVHAHPNVLSHVRRSISGPDILDSSYSSMARDIIALFGERIEGVSQGRHFFSSFFLLVFGWDIKFGMI